MISSTEKRKKEHIELCVKKDVGFDKKTTLLECVELNYKSLPQINLKEVDLNTEFLGKKFSAPLMVSAITGGAQVSKEINCDIAEACEALGIGFGLGSMRAMIEHPSLTETYFVRDKAPNCFIAGNIGAAQIMQYKPEDVEAALLAVEANALAIHVNAAQEAMQPEGDTDFFGVSERIAEYADKIKLPVYVKEVGHGISFETAFLLKDTKIKAIDVEGAGGTSWTRVDALRHKESFGEDFRDYGLPTAISLIETKNALRGTGKKIIASGGIRSGLDIAKSLCLGADMSGMALPVLKAQQKKGANGVREYLEKIITETRISLFLSGAKNISEMQKQHYAVTGRLKEWLKQ